MLVFTTKKGINMNELSTGLKLSDVVEEYDKKYSAIQESIEAFERAGQELRNSATMFGEFGNKHIDTGRVHESFLKESLLKSSWLYVYRKLNIETLATAKDKKIFEQEMASPPEFTIDNIRASFGDYLLNPRENILRGLAEVFGGLDSAYKSHEKMKIGVKGLPKKIILSGFSQFGYGAWERLTDVLNAVGVYQGKPLLSYWDVKTKLESQGDYYMKNHYKDGDLVDIKRGCYLTRFKNGNGHLVFDKETLFDINKALSEYYGDVLADCNENNFDGKKQQSTVVAKDLQYYPTPKKIVNLMLEEIYLRDGDKVLEPSCGCGRIMDAAKKKDANVIGFEIHAGRAKESIDKGHNVIIGNFLESVPTGDFDKVIMNPPFYGKHYHKHIEHAMKFLKHGGILCAVLPVTARYDHGLIKNGSWRDLPIGSFRESGTNVNTTILKIRKN